MASVHGGLRHESESGDGVRARVVSSRAGELGNWRVHHGRENINLDQIEVKRGDTLDFAVDCFETIDSDSFFWSPVVKLTRNDDGTQVEWISKQDFGGPKELPKPLGAWEKFAQVLLMSNELIFVD